MDLKAKALSSQENCIDFNTPNGIFAENSTPSMRGLRNQTATFEKSENYLDLLNTSLCRS